MNMGNRLFHLALLSLLTATSLPWAYADKDIGNIRLVLQLTVDGLRADLLARYADRFSDDGFMFLKHQGTVYTNAHYQHANTETIVGHSTLATGAQPAATTAQSAS